MDINPLAALRLPDDGKETGHFVPQFVKETRSKKLGFSRISTLLGSSRNKLEERLIASMQWAGRATTDTRKEEAFLLYMIALESIVLADGDKQEVAFRLKLRVAHLLGNSLAERRAIFIKMGKL